MLAMWVDPHPRCDFCRTDLTQQPYFVDGRTLVSGRPTGPWALMCPDHYSQHGVKRLGTGWGQKYDGPTRRRVSE
jgi:hypothetical protein